MVREVVLIVSKSVLSDDIDEIIDRLRPSLAPLQGCDIVDLLPGNGLWSAKINEALKPRRHLLVEPYYDAGFSSFLDPLLAEEKRNFTLVKWIGLSDLLSPKKYIEAGLLPDQKDLLPTSEPRRHEVNNSLLILNQSLVQHTRALLAKAATARDQITDNAGAAITRDGFHRAGIVRTLGWLPDDEKHVILPRHVGTRMKTSMLLEWAFQTHEVAGSAIETQQKNRDTELDHKSSIKVLQRMKEAGIHIDPERLDETPRHIVQTQAESEAGLSDEELFAKVYSNAHGKTANEILREELEAEYAAGKFIMRLNRPKKEAVYDQTPEQIAKARKLGKLRTADKDWQKWRVLFNEMIREERDIHTQMKTLEANPDLDEESRKAQLDILNARQEALNTSAGKLSLKETTRFSFLAEDTRLFLAEPQILAWDKRPYEPLITKPTSFYPQRKPLALLDFQAPRQDFPLTSRQIRYMEHMLHVSALSITAPVTQMLDTLAPNAAEKLIPQCPSIRDFDKGGSPNIAQLKVRSLSIEMFVELARAWDAWAFAPEPVEMARSLMWSRREKNGTYGHR
ncbi:hypothetical protein MMC25_004668 [Agyrium rufum]|nr:hypothetical protein [Agyrium rufum]